MGSIESRLGDLSWVLAPKRPLEPAEALVALRRVAERLALTAQLDGAAEVRRRHEGTQPDERVEGIDHGGVRWTSAARTGKRPREGLPPSWVLRAVATVTETFAPHPSAQHATRRGGGRYSAGRGWGRLPSRAASRCRSTSSAALAAPSSRASFAAIALALSR